MTLADRMNIYGVRKITKGKRNLLYKFFKKKLETFGCPDSYLTTTADTMVKDVLRLLKLEVVE